jgi:hypothetical protein
LLAFYSISSSPSCAFRMASSLQVLLALGRKASSICGESGSDEVLADVAYFLLTATHRRQLAESPAGSSPAAALPAEFHDLQRVRIASGTVAVALTATLSQSAGSNSATSSSGAVRVAVERVLTRWSSAHSPGPFQAPPRVWLEDMGEVGAHVVFRNASVASQWIAKVWRRLQQADTTSPGTLRSGNVVHVVFHFTLSHVPPGLMEGPFQQFLHLLDATALSFRAAAMSRSERSDESTRRRCHVVPSVLVEAASSLVASVGREKLMSEISLISSPRIVVTSVAMQRTCFLWHRGGTTVGAAGRDDTEGDIGRCVGRGSILQHQRNVPLCLFLRDAIASLGVVLSKSAMQVLLASWSVSHAMDDAVMMLHLMTCSFDETLGSGSARTTTRAAEDAAAMMEENTNKLFRSMTALSRYLATDTYEAQAVAFACLLEAVAMGVFTAVDIRGQVAACCGSADAGRVAVTLEDLDRVEDASSRRLSVRWLTAGSWRTAVAVASLEVAPTLMDDVPMADNGQHTRGKRLRGEVPLPVNADPARRSVLSFSSESEEILGSLSSTPSVSLRSAMTNAILQRVQPVDDSVRAVRRVAASAEASVGPHHGTTINYFHELVPASVRVLSVLTHVGASSSSLKRRWVPVERLLTLCCAGDDDLLLHAVRQLRIAGLIAVNGSTGAVRSLLLT